MEAKRYSVCSRLMRYGAVRLRLAMGYFVSCMIDATNAIRAGGTWLCRLMDSPLCSQQRYGKQDKAGHGGYEYPQFPTVGCGGGDVRGWKGRALGGLQ